MDKPPHCSSDAEHAKGTRWHNQQLPVQLHYRYDGRRRLQLIIGLHHPVRDYGKTYHARHP